MRSLVLISLVLPVFCELLSIQLVTRHGDRAPQFQMPLDPTNWTDIFDLTGIGMNQHYQLGRALHQHYSDLLPLHYHTRDIYVRASGCERALVSAVSQLQGIFPPGSGPDIEGTTTPALPNNVQPVPIMTTDSSAEYLLRAFDLCPRALALMDELLFKTPEFQSYWASQAAFIDRLSALTGMPNLHVPRNFLAVADTLAVEKSRGFPWPAGIDEAMYNQTQAMWAPLFVATFPRNDRFTRVSMGLFIRELLSNFKADVAHTADARKYRLYSAHDSTVLAYLAAINHTMIICRHPPKGDNHIIGHGINHTMIICRHPPKGDNHIIGHGINHTMITGPPYAANVLSSADADPPSLGAFAAGDDWLTAVCGVAIPGATPFSLWTILALAGCALLLCCCLALLCCCLRYRNQAKRAGAAGYEAVASTPSPIQG
ncbi:putative acid phosphatase [Paratrimastix pyriformis]|uniref:Acid phosphatase n=1 Tax=Paratrimastix pyriformis TaxID=342808 RepID=A0ABQ8UIP0_9EUKA|nr:putative acid phosphatase [Paratrimastix pyriformis]